MMKKIHALLIGLFFMNCAIADGAAPEVKDRLRVIIETDAGGDPDDEQSLVRFLLYCNEWDVEGIIANRPEARARENLNPERTGLGIVRLMLKAYAQCYSSLVQHDKRFPAPDYLVQRTVAGYDDTQEGVNLILAAADSSDPRPIWFCNWGTGNGTAASSLERALDIVLRERGPSGYAKFKNRFRLSSADRFGDHTTAIDPPWALWIDTFRPELNGQRWYHRFSALTATAGGFDLHRDLLAGHGPLGALYPTNTTHPQKEGDTMTFLYLVPTGLNIVEQPSWGSWAGRYGPNEMFPDKPYYWANQLDTWQGTLSRDNCLRRWAAHLQNDFKARLDWCVKDFAHANHPPMPNLEGPICRTVKPGERIDLDASGATDPDNDSLRFEWIYYSEAGAGQANDLEIHNATSPKAWLVVPNVTTPHTNHIILVVTDTGQPPLTRYKRLILGVIP